MQGVGLGRESEDVTGLPAELETHSCTAQWGHRELGKLRGRKARVREPQGRVHYLTMWSPESLHGKHPGSWLNVPISMLYSRATE